MRRWLSTYNSALPHKPGTTTLSSSKLSHSPSSMLDGNANKCRPKPTTSSGPSSKKLPYTSAASHNFRNNNQFSVSVAAAQFHDDRQRPKASKRSNTAK